MTKEVFLAEQTSSERRIKRRCVPLGIIYSIRMGATIGIVGILFLLCYFTSARELARPLFPILWGELAFCLLIFCLSFLAERASKRSFIRLSLKCPSCPHCLAFDRSEKLLKTGRCPDCDARIFEI